MSIKWNGKPCPSCRNGVLNHGAKKTVFDYRGKSFEYEQLGAWCDQCSEKVEAYPAAGCKSYWGRA